MDRLPRVRARLGERQPRGAFRHAVDADEREIAFLVDAYRGEVRDFTFPNFFLFVFFFPQLIAGPIVHHREVMPQIARLTNTRRRRR